MPDRTVTPRLRCAVADTTVIAMALPSEEQHLVRSLLPHEVSFVPVARVADLLTHVRSASAPVLLYRLPAHAPDGLPRTLIHELHEALGGPLQGLPSVALCSGGTVDARLVPALRALEHVELVIADAWNARQAIWTALERVLASSVASALLSSLGPIEPAFVHRVLAATLPLAGHDVSVLDVADALGMHERTLRKRLQAVSGPSPQWLIGWARLLVAAWHLRSPRRSVSEIADVLAFSASQNLSRMARRYTGLGMSEFRQGDPVAIAAGCFRVTRGQALTLEGAA